MADVQNLVGLPMNDSFGASAHGRSGDMANRRPSANAPTRQILIIGGGFAGLAAATALSERGIAVTVVEGRQILGGRAFSFTDPDSGDSIDNGQHLMMGCYHQTIQFLLRIGTLNKMYFQKNLTIPFAGPRGRRAKLRCLPLQAPWHLYSGLSRLSTLSLMDRWRLRHVEKALKKNTPEEALDAMTVDAWLTTLHQSPRAKRRLWDLITVATLNENSKIASAAPFVTVLKQAFFADWSDSRLGLSTVGLTELYVPAAAAMIEKAGGQVLTKSPVERLDIQDNRIKAVILRDGRRLEADAVISTVPPGALVKLLPKERVEQEPYFKKMTELRYAPIISIHLWFDREITPYKFVGLLDTTIQWLFNRSKIHAHAKTQAGYISLVISGAHAYDSWPENKILSLAIEELRRIFPAAQAAALLRSRVIKEHAATLSPSVGVEALRPRHASPIPNLFVGGDWTKTGLPATIESACVSGHACAALVLEGTQKL
jgi:hydroxysqualene dehydroxylase